VVPSLSGILFDDQSVDTLIGAIEGFREGDFDPVAIVAHASGFSREVFTAGMRQQIDRLMG
jgi:hypothetical protein